MNNKTKGLLLTGVVAVLAVVAALLVGHWSGSKDTDPVAPAVSSSRSPVASATATPGSKLPTVAVGKLPAEALATLKLIDRGGPFPYKQDGVVFENRQRLLPGQAKAYYHEYTVRTPGSPDRGARRLIQGDRGDLYYTADHYESFQQVLR